MLEAARTRFADIPDTTVLAHNLEHPFSNLVGLGTFDLVVSSFAMHHVGDSRKNLLYREAFELLTPGYWTRCRDVPPRSKKRSGRHP